ncbi:MAG: hypothetical protein A2033_05065 [Bacteroidetes bacterium GWA2_31_9]|nr:MAG: hypothetical protein A2033_05065 [Bacteroidetes bacterium GWA2_31_9]
MAFDRFTIFPAVNRHYLYIFAGGMWFAVGVMLNNLAFHWLQEFGGEHRILYAILGICAAIIIFKFGFVKIAKKNIKRIKEVEGKRNVFTFMSWKSYLIVVVMMIMGITLRHSDLPKQYLAIMYIAIGGALAISSIPYFINFIWELKS